MGISNINLSYVVFFAGYPGVGKSTFAKLLADAQNAILLNSDAARLSMFGSSRQCDRIFMSDKERFYDEVHGALFYATQQVLENGRSVVLDAQLARRKDRTRIRAIARSSGALPVFIWMTADPHVAKSRSMNRRASQHSRRFLPSEIDFVFDVAFRRLESPKSNEDVLFIDGEARANDQLRIFNEYLGRRAMTGANTK